MVLDDPETDAEAEACALTSRFCGKKWIKESIQDALGNPGTVITETDLNPGRFICNGDRMAGDPDLLVW